MKKLWALIVLFGMVAAFVVGCDEGNSSYTMKAMSRSSRLSTNEAAGENPAEESPKDETPRALGPQVLLSYDGKWEGSTSFSYQGTNYLATLVSLEFHNKSDHYANVHVVDIPEMIHTNQLASLSPLSWDPNSRTATSPGGPRWAYPFILTFSSLTEGVLRYPTVYGGFSMNIRQF